MLLLFHDADLHRRPYLARGLFLFFFSGVGPLFTPQEEEERRRNRTHQQLICSVELNGEGAFEALGGGGQKWADEEKKSKLDRSRWCVRFSPEEQRGRWERFVSGG